MQCHCEYLFCQHAATTRFTVPHHKPRTFLCEEHTTQQLEWAQPYRHVLGAVILEPLEV